MKKLIVFGILAALFFLTVEGFTILGVKNAECAWCPSYPCFHSSACGSCACAKIGGETSGVCVSFDVADRNNMEVLP